MSIHDKWFAVYTRPRWEKKVADLLTAKQIENYCPLSKVQRQWSDRKKIVLEPVFKSYVFVRVAESGRLPVLQTDGILNFVKYQNKPAIIRDEEIDVIKRFLNDYQNVQLEKYEAKVKDTVRIVSGPFLMRQGNIVEVRNNVVKVMLPSIGFMMVAEVKKTNIELIASHKSTLS